MKKCVSYVAMLAVALASGCSTTMLCDETRKDDNVSHKVSVFRGGVFTKASVEKAAIDYNGVKIGLGGYSESGDSEMFEAVARGILFVYTAVQTGGAAPAVSAVAQAMRTSCKGVATNKVESVCAPGSPAPPDPCAPQTPFTKP